MTCKGRVVIFRDTGGGIEKMELVCEGTCGKGKCTKIQSKEVDLNEEELKRHGIKPDNNPKYKFVEVAEKCECIDVEHYAMKGEESHEDCCHIELVTIGQIEIQPTPGWPRMFFVHKKYIRCRRDQSTDCTNCICDRVPQGEPQRRIGEDGEFAGTSESVICKCM